MSAFNYASGCWEQGGGAEGRGGSKVGIKRGGPYFLNSALGLRVSFGEESWL